MNREKFITKFEYPFQVLLQERGHHLQHILDAYNEVLQSGIELGPKNYSEKVLEIRENNLDDIRFSIELMDNLLQLLSRFKNERWFVPLFSLLVAKGFEIKMSFYQNSTSNQEIDYTDLDLVFKYQLAYILNYINPVFFHHLQLPRKWFDNTSIHVLTTKVSTDFEVDGGWGVNPEYLESFVARYKELYDMSYNDMYLLIELVMQIVSSDFIDIYLPAIASGQINRLAIDIQKYIQFLESRVAYYNEINSAQLVHPNLKLANKLIELLNNTDGWFVLNTLPGELCKINGSDNKPECAQHCLRSINSRVDSEILELIRLFVAEYPEFSRKILFQYDHDQIVEVAINSTVLNEKEFRKVFDKFYFRRT